MYTKRNYSFWMTFNWSKKPFLIGTLYALLICSISYLFKINLHIPWQPISIIGIAVAFYLGFKNNSSYDRTWEARKIWGGIVNDSRTFASACTAFVKGEKDTEVRKELIYRHIAWITTLRHQLRLSQPWEHSEERIKGVYWPQVCENYNSSLEKELSKYLSPADQKRIKGKSNMATQLLNIQSERLQELRDQDYYEDFRHMEFHKLITSFYANQGKSERIKNFPFPRQYASTALWMTVVFSVLAPFGILSMFKDDIGWVFWTAPLMSGLITWVFFLMEKIGDYSENPFEGTYNDIPITTIARGIEIDMREMINDTNIPPAFKSDQGFLM